MADILHTALWEETVGGAIFRMRRLLWTQLCYLLLMTELSTARPSCEYESTEGHALYGENIDVLPDVELLDCQQACDMNAECKSLDFNPHTRSCFLSDQNKETAPDLFGKHSRTDYYEKKNCFTPTPEPTTPEPTTPQPTTPEPTTSEPTTPKSTSTEPTTTEPTTTEPTTTAPTTLAPTAQPVTESDGCRESQLGTEYTGSLEVTVSGRICQRWTSQYPHEHGVRDYPFPDGSIAAAENYCRNPDNEPGGPWCYTTDPDVRWEYCDVRSCTNSCPAGTPQCDYNPCAGAVCAPLAEAKCSLDHCGGCGISWFVRSKEVSCDPPPPPYQTRCRETTHGREYLGKWSITRSGRTCQAWTSQYPHEHKFKEVHPVFEAGDGSVEAASNFCRSPGDEPEGPWCYTTDPNMRWDFCDVPFCDDVKYQGCRETWLGTEYTGTQAVTLSGRTCQRWTAQYPHEHSRGDYPFPDGSSSAAENYCRNPDNEPEGPWCYTTDPDVRWEYCDVPMCN